jgi:hypothetical protein
MIVYFKIINKIIIKGIEKPIIKAKVAEVVF